MTSVAIFGTGRIGGGVAARAASSGIISNLILYDNNDDLLNAQYLDIKHMGCNLNVSKNPDEINNSDIILFTAGLPRNPDIKTRTALLDSNLPVLTDLINHLNEYKGIIILVTNPVDILTWNLQRQLGIPRKKVIGFGGELDSARYNYELSINSVDNSINETGYVIGEHGEHQVPLFNNLLNSVPIPNREIILKKLRSASMEIIKGKGGTEYAPIWHIWNLIKAIITDSHELKICSAVLEGEYGINNCSIGVPIIIGRSGIEKIVEWSLDEWEMRQFNHAGRYLSEICRSSLNE